MTPFQPILNEFDERFSERFAEIARLADRGNDEEYGKGLARLQIDTRNFLLSKLEEVRISGAKDALKWVEDYAPRVCLNDVMGNERPREADMVVSPTLIQQAFDQITHEPIPRIWNKNS